MCQMFAGQDPQNYEFETRSIRLSGHSTSIRLESKFWVVLEELSEMQGLSMPRFLTQLHDEALAIHGEISNFASLLRCCCLVYLENDFDKSKLYDEAQSNSQAKSQANSQAQAVAMNA